MFDTIPKTVLSGLSSLELAVIDRVTQITSGRVLLGYWVPAKNLSLHVVRLSDVAATQELDDDA